MVIARSFYAYLDEMQKITVILPFSYHHGHSQTFDLSDGKTKWPLKIVEKIHLHDSLKYICTFSNVLEFAKIYDVIDEHSGKTDLQMGAVIRTKEFDETFYYEGNDLGATYDDNRTLFKVWAPTATMVKLKLQSNKDNSEQQISMGRKDKGIWMADVAGCLEGYRYTYLVQINLEWREAVDPYAKGVTVNGKQGVVIDMEKTRISLGPHRKIENPCDAIIYETHIRDLTIHPQSGAKYKGTFLGASELGTTSFSSEYTGLSYIKELGITHIEFLPFNDFAGVDELAPKESYNWGYNPVHFNVPEGSYATDPNDPYMRIIELKTLISTTHSLGMGVIMDVVYNHVFIREQSSFEQLVPGYYFRHGVNGLPANGTGVGNDFASERLMGRKFILDSITYWMTEFKLDGMRFDLMGILDIETMNAAAAIMRRINPAAIIIGEGWDLNTPIPNSDKASIGNQEKIPEISHFNDWFRDTIKGSTFNLYDRGYALGNERYEEATKQVLAGSIGIGKRKTGLFLEPKQSVNYVESHDSHTLWDKLTACEQDFLEAKHRLATSMVLLSQGIPFIHSGQEFFRTKQGIDNSYRSPDHVNWLDWDRRDTYIQNVHYIKGIIAIRKSHQAFRFWNTALIRKHTTFLSMPTPVIAYLLADVKEFGMWNDMIIYFNPSQERKRLSLPEDSQWNILADHERASTEVIRQCTGTTVEMEPVSLLIAVK